MAIPVAALMAALGPQIKKLVAAEAMNMMRKYMFNGSTKGGKEINKQMYEALEKELSGMNDKDWEKFLKSQGNDYRKKAGDWIKELIPGVAGMATGAVGNAWNLRNSILANTLNNAVGSLVSPRQAAAWGNPFQAGAQVYTGGLLAQGAIADAIGQAVGGWLTNLSQQISSEGAQDRMYRQMIDHPLTGEGYRTLRSVGKGRGGGGSSSPSMPRTGGRPPGGGGGAAQSRGSGRILDAAGRPIR